MLSRVADSLFWMSRYMERAENIARFLNVNLQLMLDVPSRQAKDLARDWFPIVASLGDEKAVPQQGSLRLGRRDIPDPDRRVPPGRGQKASVG